MARTPRQTTPRGTPLLGRTRTPVPLCVGWMQKLGRGALVAAGWVPTVPGFKAPCALHFSCFKSFHAGVFQLTARMWCDLPDTCTKIVRFIIGFKRRPDFPSWVHFPTNYSVFGVQCTSLFFLDGLYWKPAKANHQAVHCDDRNLQRRL